MIGYRESGLGSPLSAIGCWLTGFGDSGVGAREFALFLYIAWGSVAELETQLLLAG